MWNDLRHAAGLLGECNERWQAGLEMVEVRQSAGIQSVSLCLMKNDHFLNFVKARFGCVLYMYLSKLLNEVVTRIFSLGFMDEWPKSGQKRGKSSYRRVM